MKESDRTVPMLYERTDAYVIEAFRQGEFDYLEGVGEVSEADFFRALTGKNILGKLADTYPSACKKHDVQAGQGILRLRHELFAVAGDRKSDDGGQTSPSSDLCHPISIV